MNEILKRLLSEVKPELNENELAEKFKEIATELFENYVIQKGENVTYRFMEIEFYYFSMNHQDLITYPRRAEAGDWFFHPSGIDLCFDSNLKESIGTRKVSDQLKIEDAHFGGILIRSLKKISAGENPIEDPIYLTGPHKCCYDLFDRFKGLEQDQTQCQYPYLKEIRGIGKSDELKLKCCQRYLNFSTSDKKKYDNIMKGVYGQNSEYANETEFRKFINSNSDRDNQYKYRWYSEKDFNDYEIWAKGLEKCPRYGAKPSESYSHRDTGKTNNG